jgi:hypothetical protein
MEPIDLVLYAAHNGLAISNAIAREALATVDRAPLEAAETARYEAKMWDGKTDPPLGTSDRWLHGQDGSSRSAIESINNGGVVYFLYKDGVLKAWQPHRADIPGRIHMVNSPGDSNHWETAANAHIARDVAQEVDGQVLKAALNKALELHEARGIPYSATIASRP